jgi:hypothetical protein
MRPERYGPYRQNRFPGSESKVPKMSWNLQQINGQPTAGTQGEYVCCPQAPDASVGSYVFVNTFGNQQHFLYGDDFGALHDCWYDGDANVWNLLQINGGGPATSPAEQVACPQAPPATGWYFVSTFANQQHFTYIDVNWNLQDCWYGGNAWHFQQINGGDGPTVPGEYVACPQAPAVNSPSFFVSVPFENQQHFVYLDGNNNLQDCWYGGNAWHLQQINGGGGATVPSEQVACPQAPLAVNGGPVFVSMLGNQPHFTYFDAHLNLQDCWYGANVWNLQQINGGDGPTVPGEYVACPQAPPAGDGTCLFVNTFGNQQHFVYLDRDYNMQDCFWDAGSNRWNLLQINGGKATVPGEQVACPQAPPTAGDYMFVSTFGNQQHFVYLDVNNRIQDCWYDGGADKWNLLQINGGGGVTVPGEQVACPNAPEALVDRPVFVSTFGNQQHFVYNDGYGSLQDCWRS